MRREGGRSGLWWVVFLPLLAVFLLTATWTESDLSPDPVAAAMSAWSLAEDGDLTLSPAEKRNPWVFSLGGRELSNRQPGVIAAGMPYYFVTKPFTQGFSLFPMALAAASLAAAAAATLALLLRQLGATDKAAGAFAMCGALASATWTVSADALWTHSPGQLLLVLALLWTSRGRYGLAGLALGGAVTVRTHLAVVALCLGVAALAHTRRLRPMIMIGVGSAAGLGAVLVYTAQVFGTWSLNAGYTATGGYPTAALAHSSAYTTLQNLAGALVNPNRGLLLTMPVLLALAPGAVRCWRAADWWVRAAVVGGLLYLLIQSRLNGFSGGTFFWGSRLTLELLTLSAPLLWLAWRSTTGEARAGARALAAISVAIHAAGQLVGRPAVSDSWTSWFIREEAFGVPHATGVRLTMALGLAAALLFIVRGRSHLRTEPAEAPSTPVPAQRRGSGQSGRSRRAGTTHGG